MLLCSSYFVIYDKVAEVYFYTNKLHSLHPFFLFLSFLVANKISYFVLPFLFCVTFTHEILTEYYNFQPQAREKAEKEGFEVSVTKTSFKANTKALAENEGEGIAKVRFHNCSPSSMRCANII